MRTLLPALSLLALLSIAVGAGLAQTKAASQKAEPAKGAAPKAAAPVKPAAAPAAKLPPKRGSQLREDDNSCLQCHQEQDPKDPVTKRLFIDPKDLAEDVHGKRGVNCHDCHGGNPKTLEKTEAHAPESGFRGAQGARQMCAACHDGQALDLFKSVHDKAGAKDAHGQPTPLTCDACHGKLAHHLLPVRDRRSPVFLDNQLKTCGGCHPDHLETYKKSVHAQGLYKMGLAVVPACADCHGAHGIYLPNDERSTLHPQYVASLHSTPVVTTCGKCHRFIGDMLKKSVHGRHGLGGLADRPAPGGQRKETPVCTHCHQGHDLVNPESAAFRQQLPNRCGNCHDRMSQEYGLSMHGQLTALGYGPAAKCADCHGAHEILAVADQASLLAPAHRAETCGKCHSHVRANFLQFDPHADHLTAGKNPLLHAVYLTLLTLLIATFAAFGVHSAFWLVRGTIEVHRHGRPAGIVPGRPAYVRFVPFHRVAHAILLIAFLGLALTGMPLKYSTHPWAQTVAAALGGFESTGFWHRVFALVTFGCFLAYIVILVRSLFRAWKQGLSVWRVLFGPDSPVPNFRDVKDFVGMIGWFFGLGRRPTFERWAYWEKFDFWGALTDVVIIGSTGLVLWFPNLFCYVLPGSVLNLAKVIHSTQALLATGFVFAIHFFSVHLRPDKFPADLSMLTGYVSEEEMADERPEYRERLRREGRLEGMRGTVPRRRRIWLNVGLGYVALAVGMTILVGMVVAGLGH